MSTLASSRRAHEEIDWAALFPKNEWETYEPLVRALKAAEIPFALGGGLAFSAYAPRQRNTKDLDLFVLHRHVPQIKAVLAEQGYADYFSEQPYDRSWIYRAHKNGAIIDIIWTMPNHRFVIEEEWLEQGPEIELHGVSMKLLPMEAIIRTKVYVMQFDRCDWPDLVNVLYSSAGRIDWHQLISDMGDDRRLLGSLLNLFAWICPEKARQIEPSAWHKLGLQDPSGEIVSCEKRAHLLDTRDWFGPTEE